MRKCYCLALFASLIGLIPIFIVIYYLYLIAVYFNIARYHEEIPAVIPIFMLIHPMLIAATTGLGYLVGGKSVLRRRRALVASSLVVSIGLVVFGQALLAYFGFLVAFIVPWIDLLLIPVYFYLIIDIYRVFTHEHCQDVPALE